MLKTISTTLAGGVRLGTWHQDMHGQMSVRDDILIPLCKFVLWLLPWPILCLLGICLLYVLQGTVSFTPTDCIIRQ